MADNDRYVIEILDLALNAIEKMASSENEYYSLTSLAQQLNINRSRLFRILKTYQRHGYVEYEPKTETYRLGLKFLIIGQHLSNNLNLRREAEGLLKDLAAKTGDCVHLIGLSGNQAVVIDRYLGDNILQGAARIGQPLPLHTGAAPKLLLAYLPDPERQQMLDEIPLNPYTPYTITDKEELIQALNLIRQVGYAEDDQDFELGVYAIGAPVFDHSGCVIAGVSITTPVLRFNSERREELIELVVTTAGKISSHLGIEYPFNVIFIIINGFMFYGGKTPMFYFFRWPFTVEGFIFGISVCLKILSVVLMIPLLTMTTTLPKLMAGLATIRLPYKFIFTFGVAMRLVPLVTSTYFDIMASQRLRGHDLSEMNYFKRLIKGYVPLFIPLVLTMLRRTADMDVAIESRGFGAPVERTYLEEVRPLPADYLALGVSLIVFAGIFVYLYLNHAGQMGLIIQMH